MILKSLSILHIYSDITYLYYFVGCIILFENGEKKLQ